MKKETIKHVNKVWGEEIWLVNNDRYCGKLLIFDGGAEGSYHYHKDKRETFFTWEGYGTLIIEGRKYVLASFMLPQTIEPMEKHQIIASTPLVILEISTTHSEDDVVRITESKGA